MTRDLKDMASEFEQLIQEESAVMRQRHLARHRHVTPPISPTSEMM
jgi:hypothetical protein